VRVLLLLLLICQTHFAVASEAENGGLTDGKEFLPWLWQDQLKPTAAAALSARQGLILGGGALATAFAHQYDADVRDQFGRNRRIDANVSRAGSILGSGGPGVAIALTQLFVDQKNGLRSTRALLFTSFTHFTSANIIHRERPNGHPLAFPSGHTSSSFATATSLAYAYGPYVGVPALALATFVGVTRIADDAHWVSDTVAGAALGIFWARASAMADANSATRPPPSAWMPVLIPGGATLAYSADF
jgi:hypothetical protein